MYKRSIVLLALFSIVLSGVGCGGGKAGNAGQRAVNERRNERRADARMAGGETGGMQRDAAPNCGAVKAVWVNLKTKVYHEPDDPLYGKTKHGEYLCPSQANAAGYRRAGERGSRSAMRVNERP